MSNYDFQAGDLLEDLDWNRGKGSWHDATFVAVALGAPFVNFLGDEVIRVVWLAIERAGHRNYPPNRYPARLLSRIDEDRACAYRLAFPELFEEYGV